MSLRFYEETKCTATPFSNTSNTKFRTHLCWIHKRILGADILVNSVETVFCVTSAPDARGLFELIVKLLSHLWTEQI